MTKHSIKRKLTRLLFGAAAGLAVCGLANATVIDSSKDSYIEKNSPGSNFGSASSALIKLDTSATQWIRKTYLGFDLTGIGTIRTAALNLDFVDSGRGSTGSSVDYTFEVFGLTGQSLASWGETAITWNNAPGNETAGNGLSSAVSLGSFTRTGKGVGSAMFSSAALRDFLNADINDRVTIILRRDTTAGSNNYIHAIATRENTAQTAPSLNLTVPEPATLLLLGLGMAGIGFGHKWRKKA